MTSSLAADGRSLVTSLMRFHTEISRRASAAAAGAVLLLLLLAPLSACSTYHAYFPSRDEVYKPVPVSLGEPRVAGGDTTYVLSGRGYRVATRDRDLLPDAKIALDRTSSAYRRFVAVEPPTIDVRLQVMPRPGDKPDTARQQGAVAVASPTPDTGRVVTMVAWRTADRNDRRDGGGSRGRIMGGGGYSTALVHAWLATWADEITHAPPTARRAPADSGSGGARNSSFGATPAADDPRIPDWIERAIPALVAGSPDPEVAAMQLARHPDRLIPLRTLLTARRPDVVGGGDGGDDRARVEAERRNDDRRGGGGRERGRRGRGDRNAALEGGALFDAQAMSVAAYLAEREGGAFVGDVYRTVVSGLTLEDALRAAHTLPRDLDALERGWRGWLDAQAGKAEDYGPRSRGDGR